MNWDIPEDRAALIERVGPDEYNRQHQEHLRKSVVTTVNGYGIRPTQTRFGRLFAVDGTNMAFDTMVKAIAHANSLPTKEPVP